MQCDCLPVKIPVGCWLQMSVFSYALKSKSEWILNVWRMKWLCLPVKMPLGCWLQMSQSMPFSPCRWPMGDLFGFFLTHFDFMVDISFSLQSAFYVVEGVCFLDRFRFCFLNWYVCVCFFSDCFFFLGGGGGGGWVVVAVVVFVGSYRARKYHF